MAGGATKPTKTLLATTGGEYLEDQDVRPRDLQGEGLAG